MCSKKSNKNENKKRKLLIFPQKNHYLGNRCFCRYFKIEKTNTMYPKLFSDLKRKTTYHIQLIPFGTKFQNKK